MPTLCRTKYASADNCSKGGYVLADCEGTPDVILMGSGSELGLCVTAAETLTAEGKKVRVVSMPCMDLFAEQSQAYRDQVLPPAVTNRVAVEAGIRMCWDRWIGSEGKFVGMSGYGASGPYNKVYEHFGINADAVVAAANA
jgi:transketolase